MLLHVVVTYKFCSFSCFFFFKQKTAYEMRISDWSSDVCSSDLRRRPGKAIAEHHAGDLAAALGQHGVAVREVAVRSGCTLGRSEERRVGKACVSTCRSRW